MSNNSDWISPYNVLGTKKKVLRFGVGEYESATLINSLLKIEELSAKFVLLIL